MNLEPRIEAVSCKLNSHVYPVNTIACTKVQFFDNFLRPKVPEGSKFSNEEKKYFGLMSHLLSFANFNYLKLNSNICRPTVAERSMASVLLRSWRRSRVHIPVSASLLPEKSEEKSRRKVEQDLERVRGLRRKGGSGERR